MKKIFIDCGSHDGCSVRKIMAVRGQEEFKFYCFEINKGLEKFYEDIKDKIHLIFKGVDTENKISSMLRMGLTGGSTLDLRKKKTLYNKQFPRKKFRPYYSGCDSRKDCLLFDFDQSCKAASLHQEEVEVIDLSSWIKKTFSEDDYIVLKMDVEGIEYKIIDHMVKNQTFEMIDELLIEFHMTNEYNIGKFTHKILKQNPKIKIDTTWDAMHPPFLKNEFCEEFYKTYKRKITKFRQPLSHEEKIKAIQKFLQDNKLQFEIKTDDNFFSFKHFLNDRHLIEAWKKFIFKVGTGENK